MNHEWVVNASPLILLAKVDQLELLSRLTKSLVVPASVAAEINQGPPDDAARRWLAGSGAAWIQADVAPVTIITAWDLGAGEAAVLNWSVTYSGFEAILDDRAARKCAATLGLPVRGTIGVILAAKKNRLLPAATPICEALVRAGLLIKPDYLQAALRLVDE